LFLYLYVESFPSIQTATPTFEEKHNLLSSFYLSILVVILFRVVNLHNRDPVKSCATLKPSQGTSKEKPTQGNTCTGQRVALSLLELSFYNLEHTQSLCQNILERCF
jgi:hypothetical protein